MVPDFSILPSQPVAEAPVAETDAVPGVDEIVEEAPASEDALLSQPAAEPVQGALPDQEVAAPVVTEASAGYQGNELADTHSLAEETPIALAAAAMMLDDAEMENIFGCNIFRRNWNRNRTIPTTGAWNRQPVQVSQRRVADGAGVTAALVSGGIGLAAAKGTIVLAPAVAVGVGVVALGTGVYSLVRFLGVGPQPDY